MKTATQAQLDILNSAGSVQILRADVYTFTLRNGEVLRYTDADRKLTVSGNTFTSGPVIQRSKTKHSVGVTVDSMQVTIVDNGSTLVSGKPIIHQFKNGYFKGAILKVEKLFLLDWNDTSPGGIFWFEGKVASPACDHMAVNFEVRSMLADLNKQMPEDVYQPTCGNQLFDNVCGALESSFTFSNCTAGTVTNRAKFVLSGTAQSDGYFALGKVRFTSGANAGQPARTIKSYVGGVVEVFQPFPYDIAQGDACVAVAGCDKVFDSSNGCGKFGRKEDGFQATPFIPVPETAVEGGGVTGTVQTSGAQGRGVVGSAIMAARRRNTYQK